MKTFHLTRTTSLLAAILFISSAIAEERSVYVANCSFETPTNNADWTYSAIESWSSNSHTVGVCSGGHADNGIVPDKYNVAFIDTMGTTTGGFVQIKSPSLSLDTNAQYTLQFWHNARQNLNTYTTNFCIFSVNVGQNLLGTYTNWAVGIGNPYDFKSFTFTPKYPSARIVFNNYRLQDSGPGTGTLSCLLIDAVCLYKVTHENEVVVKNPSFEASGDQGPGGGVGFINKDAGWNTVWNYMAGWDYYSMFNHAAFGTGSNSNPYIAPAVVPEGICSFIDSKGEPWYPGEYFTRLSQTIEGLTIGQKYNLSYYYNARPDASYAFSPSNFTVSIGGIQVQHEDLLLWEPTFQYTSVTFVANWETMDLVFQTSNSVDSCTMCIDDVCIWPDVTKDIEITTSPGVVGNDETTCQLSGTATSTVVGGMWITNATIGGAALSFPAAVNWTTPSISLAVGANTLSVCGTNTAGDVTCENTTVTRLGPGRTIYIQNCSFENPTNPPALGVTNIVGWSQNRPDLSGVNPSQSGFVFLDNGRWTDKNQVAFLWSFGADVELRQTLYGLNPSKTYCLQFWHNSGTVNDQWNTNLCEFIVEFGGTVLTTMYSRPVDSVMNFSSPFHFSYILFTPGGSSGDLCFRNLYTRSTGSNYISRLMLDAICLYEIDYPDEIIIKNPSFEASGEQSPGGGGTGAINMDFNFNPLYAVMAGWDYWDGGYNSAIFGTGTNGNPYFEGAPIPEGNNAFYDNKDERFYINSEKQTQLRQMIEGLTLGETYELSYYYNSRPEVEFAPGSWTRNPSNFTVSIGGIVVHQQDVLEWNPTTNFFYTNLLFTANYESMQLVFGTSNSPPVSATMSLDDIRIKLIPEPFAGIVILCGIVAVLRLRYSK